MKPNNNRLKPETRRRIRNVIERLGLDEASLRNHDCKAAGKTSWWENDARNIPLCRVCVICRAAELKQFRPEILNGYNQNDVNEPIEPDEQIDHPQYDDFIHET